MLSTDEGWADVADVPAVTLATQIDGGRLYAKRITDGRFVPLTNVALRFGPNGLEAAEVVHLYADEDGDDDPQDADEKRSVQLRHQLDEGVRWTRLRRELSAGNVQLLAAIRENNN